MQNIQKKRKIQLSDHFTYSRLIRFTLPSIIIMIFSSLYGVVDGYFISNIVGKTAFASVNLIIPFVQIISGLGVLLGADGGSLISRTLGTGNREKAGRYFTMTMAAMLFGGILFTVVGLITLRPAALYLGATEEMLQDCLTYGGICIMFSWAQLAQNILLGYLVVAEKPKFALRVMIFAFLLSIVLNVVFVGEDYLNLGVKGAALSTGISQTVAAGIPFLWFISKRNKTALRFRRTKIDLSVLRSVSYNGITEIVSVLAASIIGLLYNVQLMKYSGPDAVAAYGVVLYVSFVFTNVYTGYSNGALPIMGYHYGAVRFAEMRNVFKKSVVILIMVTAAMLSVVTVFAHPIAEFFVGYDEKLLEMTIRTLSICLLPFLFMWFNIYMSSVLSAIGKGATAAFLTVLRAIVFPVACIFIMPEIWGLDGVWYALTGAEVISAIISMLVLASQKKKFGY